MMISSRNYYPDSFVFSVYFLISGAIIFGSDQEVREVMRAVRRNNATGMFSWIGSDGWSARNLVSDGNEPEVSITCTLANTTHAAYDR